MTPALLFRGVDRAAFAAALVSRLREHGLPLPLSATRRLTEGLEAVRPGDRRQLYWTARTCLLDDVSQHEPFDRVFEAVFGRASSALAPPERRCPTGPADRADDGDVHLRVRGHPARQPGGGGVPWATPPSATEPDDDLAPGLTLPELLPTHHEALSDVPFDQLDSDELALVGAYLERIVLTWPARRSRRLRPSSRRRSIDRRRTLRATLRTAGEPVELAFAARVERPRGVVMLADVSGSMQSYARAYLHLMRALGSVAEAETFAFSTRLTRLTPVLRHRDPRTAIERATAEVEDRFGGTRIATSLQQLLRSPVWSTTVRGAVVVIVSDGWDTDPPTELDARLRRLRRLSHRIVWVNPRAAAGGFEPTTGGMSASLPHCDVLVSGHSLSAMRELFDAMAVGPPAPARGAWEVDGSPLRGGAK